MLTTETVLLCFHHDSLKRTGVFAGDTSGSTKLLADFERLEEILGGGLGAEGFEIVITPADGSVGHAGFMGGFSVADFIADVNRFPGCNPAGAEDGAELGRLAKDGGAAGEVLEERGILRSENGSDGVGRVGTNNTEHDVRLRELLER